MRATLRSSLTYANVMSTLCFFLLLGGTSVAAVALKKNSVRSKHIRNGQVQNADLRAGAVDGAKVADGSLGASDLAGDTLSGLLRSDDADARYLPRTGKATDAAALGGRSSAEYLQGRGRSFALTGKLVAGNSGAAQLPIPGVGTLSIACIPDSSGLSPTAMFTWRNGSGGAQNVWHGSNHHTLANDQLLEILGSPVQVTNLNNRVTTITVNKRVTSGNQCPYAISAIDQDA